MSVAEWSDTYGIRQIRKLINWIVNSLLELIHIYFTGILEIDIPLNQTFWTRARGVHCSITYIRFTSFIYIYIYIYVMYHEFIPLHSRDYLSKVLIKLNMTTDKNMTLRKLWNRSSCTKMSLSTIWTHCLTGHSVRASERNSVVMGSNHTHVNFP